MKFIRITWIVAFVSLPFFSFAQWSVIFSSDTLMKNIYFKDANSGFVLGYQRIFKTTNGGATWSSFPLSAFFDPRGIYFPSPDTGYIVGHGNGSLVLKTIDGGDNWEEIFTGLAPSLNDVFFFNSDTGIVVAEGNSIVKTNDGFQSSEVQSVPEPFTSILSLSFPSRDTGFICGAEGGGGNYMRTFDGGSTWNNGGFATPFKDVFFISSQTGFLTGGSAIAKTINSGDIWSNKNVGSNFFSLYDLFFFSKDTGYAVGDISNDTSLIIKSNDAGENWFRTSVPDSVGSVTSIFCLSNEHCFACTGGGKILETSNGGGFLSIHEIDASGFSVYPNPANSKFSVTTSEFGQLTITNELGQVLHSFAIHQTEMQISTSKFTSGIYFLIFQNGKTIQTKKIIVQH